jgi:hypothetical protein
VVVYRMFGSRAESDDAVPAARLPQPVGCRQAGANPLTSPSQILRPMLGARGSGKETSS